MWVAILLVQVATVVWIGIDASRRDFSNDGFANKTWKWVVGALVFWILVAPLYLIRRNRAPLKAQ